MRIVFSICLALACTGCLRTALPSPETALIPINAPRLSDDLPLASLADAIEVEIAALKKNPETVMRFGPLTTTRGRYASALEDLGAKIRQDTDSNEIYSYIESKFQFLEVAGNKTQGQVLLTSYFEPQLEGTLSPTSRFTQPLYRVPEDLVTVALPLFSEKFKDESSLRGRLDGTKVVPYLTREEIDGSGKLSSRGLEICWVDPIDAFFLHIQGSGTVTLQDGQNLHLVFAEKNGRKYEAIGKFLKALLPKGRVTLQSIERFLRSLSVREQQKYMFMNPSYVFFSPSKKRAITSLGVPATPGRTIAADGRFFPKGALAFIKFPKPEFESPSDSEPRSMANVSRFVLDQDSGGAITGTGRVDLFWGRGNEAKQAAGVVQEEATVMYLVPRE